MYAFVAKEISEIPSYHIILNVLTLSLSLVFPSPVSPIYCYLHVPQTNDKYKVKTFACEAVFQFKSNLNVFKGVVIIDQEIVAAFTSFITTVKRTL